jgi:hypothetical protein
MLHAYWTSVCIFLIAEQKSSLHILQRKSSNDQDHADGNIDCRSIDASEETIGDDSNEICSNPPNASCSTSRDALTGCIPGDWSP